MLCKNCGKGLTTGISDYCPNCGAKVSNSPISGVDNTPTEVLDRAPVEGLGRAPVRSRSSKSKAVSILLAVFLTFWTWLYTYKKDKWKFWAGLGLAILSSILVTLTWGLSSFFLFGIWIWTIVDVAAKKDDWYRSYN